MSLLAELRKPPEEHEAPRRWITVLDEEAGIEAPKFEVEIIFQHPEAIELINRPYRKQVGNIDMMMLDWPYRLKQEDRQKYLRLFFKRAVGNWRGFGRKNIARLCPDAVNNPAKVATLPDEVPFSDDVRDDFAVMMDKDYYPFLYRSATNTDEWGIQLGEKKVLDSDGTDSPSST